MEHFVKEEAGIFLLKVPFEDLYTSVFALVSEKGSIILDTATTDEDVQTYILPAIQKLGIVPTYIICSHSHDDHAGGMPELLKHFPNAIAGLADKNRNFENETRHLTDGEILLDRFQILNLRGHTEDSLAIFDLQTKTLLSGDCLQQQGVGKYTNGITDKQAYRESIARVRGMDIERIIFSHDYDPCGYSVKGKEEINSVLDVCINWSYFL